jgi:ABC-type transport system substrate-binding protein
LSILAGRAGRWLAVAFWMAFRAASAGAQAPPTVVIGDLTGRWEPDRATVFTSRGRFPLFGSDDKAPFVVARNGAREVLIQFRPAVRWRSHRPPRILYRIFPTERRLITALILEEVDFAELPREESAVEVRKSNPVVVPIVQYLPKNTVTLILYNHRLPLFKDRSVRIALAHAMNRRKIVRELLGDKASIARGPLDDDSWAYAPGLEELRYNPKLSVRMLSAAGWQDRDGDGLLDKNGQHFQFTLIYPEGLLLEEQLVRQIKLSLSEVGIHVRQVAKPMPELRAELRSGTFEAALLQVRFEESGESFREFFGSNGKKNFMGFRDPTLDRYLEIYFQTDDASTRKKLLQRMQLVLNREQPAAFLYFKWVTHFLVNLRRLEDVRDGRGGILPVDQWVVKPRSKFIEP